MSLIASVTNVARPGCAPRRLDDIGRLAWFAAAIAILYAVVLGSAALQGAWLLTLEGRPQPRDFTPFWLAGRMAADGRVAAVYDIARFRAALAGVLGLRGVDLPFVYPPVLLLVLEPIARAPFAVAAAIWLGSGLAGYLAMARAVLARWAALPLALAIPGVFTALVVGQNGLFSAAILGGALVQLPRRPLCAGLIFGLLVYKPQFAIAFVLVLLAGRHWRALLGATVSAGGLIVASVARFGPSSATAFLNAAAAAEARLRGDGTPFLKLQSVYGGLRSAGLAEVFAMAIHLAVAAAAATLLVILWRSRAPDALKAAGVAVATLVITPYVFIYDTAILGVAALFLLRDSLRRAFTPIEMTLFVTGVCATIAFLVATFAVTPWACASLSVLIAMRCAPASPPRQ